MKRNHDESNPEARLLEGLLAAGHLTDSEPRRPRQEDSSSSSSSSEEGGPGGTENPRTCSPG